MKQSTKNKISRSLRYHHANKRLKRQLRTIITGIQIFLVLFILAYIPVALEQLAHIHAVDYVKAWEAPEVYEVMEGNEYYVLMAQIAEEYGVDYDVMQQIAECESKFQADTQSFHITETGERENSWGIIQINRDYHDVTIEQATDPRFALKWYAQEVKEGRLWQWSCAHILDLV